MNSSLNRKPVLLSGATGFIGSSLYPALIQTGFDVVCGSRHPERASSNYPNREWVELDVHKEDTLKKAMEGCGSLLYLIHEMGSGVGYEKREKEAASLVRDIASKQGIERIVYLGGVAPESNPSEHLKSRLRTGEIFRTGDTPALELRASMILGPGSSSWTIVRDLASKLPFMILPRWTQSRTQPVYINDVVRALIGGLQLPAVSNEWYDIPGPDTLTVEEILHRTANIMDRNPITVRVPFLSPTLSSYWLYFVTRADYYLAQQLVQGLKSDLLAQSSEYWDRIGVDELVSFDQSILNTLREADLQHDF